MKTGAICVYETTQKRRIDQITEQNTFLTSVLEEVSMHVSEDDRRRITSALRTNVPFQLPSPPTAVDYAGNEGMATDLEGQSLSSHITHPEQESNLDQEPLQAPSSALFPHAFEEGYFSHVSYPDGSDLPQSTFAAIYQTPATTPQQHLSHHPFAGSRNREGSLLFSTSEHDIQSSSCGQSVQFDDTRSMGEEIMKKAEVNLVANQSFAKKSHPNYEATSILLSELEAWRNFVNVNTVSAYTPIESIVLHVLYSSWKISITKAYVQTSCGMGSETDPTQLAMITTCMNGAHEMALALPEQPNTEQSEDIALFCSMIPHFQAISVFLLELSVVRADFQRNSTTSFDSLKKLIRWLRALRRYDDTAEQAHTKVVSLFRAAANDILRSDQPSDNNSGGETIQSNTKWFGQS